MVGSSRPENVSPPGPEYQAGELSQFEQTSESGFYQTETEDEGFLPPPLPMQLSAGQAESSMGGRWFPFLPYPYDYMFVTGQYPPGTFSHSISSSEQGSDNWEDVHYMRNPASSSTGAQSFKALRSPGHGGAAAGVSAPSGGGFMLPKAGYKVSWQMYFSHIRIRTTCFY